MFADSALRAVAPLRNRRVLVTGAGGFIGANLVRLLLLGGAEVHAVVRPGSRALRLAGLAGKATVHEADVAESFALESLFARTVPEYVFHLAAARGDSGAVREAMLRLNVIGALSMIRLARQYDVRRLVVAGSSLEYGHSDRALEESDPVAPLTWHGATKAATHVLYRQAAATDALPVVWLRIFHVYGPWESAHRLAPVAIRAAQAGIPLRLTRGDIRRDWVFVDDVCEAFALASQHGQSGDVYNVGTGIETSNEELVACVEAVLGRKVRRATGEYAPRITDAEHRFADPTRAREAIGWRPQHDLAQGMRRTIEWLSCNPQAWSGDEDYLPLLV